MIILGIDIALRNNGICVLDNKKIIFHERFKPESPDFYHPEFLKEHVVELEKLLHAYNPDLVAIEGSSLASQNWQFAIGELTGVYHYFLYTKNYPVLILPPMKWKKIFTGRGDASKERIRSIAQKNFEYTPLPKHRVSQDEFDATGIAFTAYLAIKYKAGKLSKFPREWKKLFDGKDKGILTDHYLNFNLDKLKLSSIKF